MSAAQDLAQHALAGGGRADEAEGLAARRARRSTPSSRRRAPNALCTPSSAITSRPSSCCSASARCAHAVAVGELLDRAAPARAQRRRRRRAARGARARQLVERVVAQDRLGVVVGEPLERVGGARRIVQIVEVDAPDEQLRVVELQRVVAAGDERDLARGEDAAQPLERAVGVAAARASSSAARHSASSRRLECG